MPFVKKEIQAKLGITLLGFNLGLPPRSQLRLKAVLFILFSLPLTGKHQGAGPTFSPIFTKKGLPIFEMGELSFPGQLALWGTAGHLVWGSRTLAPLPLCSSSVAKVPGECSFLKSPDDLQAPSRPPVGRKLSCWQPGLPEHCAFLSSADQVVGCFFLAQKHRKRGDAKASVLAQRRDGAGELGLKHCARCPF